MKSKIISGLVLILFLLPLINADFILPGLRALNIENKIANVDDFPDYVFLSIGEGPPSCLIDVIESEVIPAQYKMCKLSVYAISKEKFNEENLPVKRSIFGLNIEDYNKVENYLSEINAIKVISDIEHYKIVGIVNTKKSVENIYFVDLNQVKTQPDKVNIERDYTKIFIYIIPLLALLIIIFIIRKRKR